MSQVQAGWELVCGPEKRDEEYEVSTHRLWVPGGWIVRTLCEGRKGASALLATSSTLVYTPDPEHEWLLVEEVHGL